MNCSNPSIYTVCNSNVVPDPSESRKYIKDIVRECFGMIAKEEQVEVLRNLVFDKQDTILIAKTGFGKSLIFLATPPIVGHDSTAVIVMPLLELEAEQCRKLQKIAGCRPFVLNGESNTTQNRQDVKIGKYTHVFTSPEIATSKLFAQGVLRNSEFYNRFCLLAVDEVHTVDEWAGFRPDYMNIFVLRARLPEKVPLFATSATIPDDLLVELKQSCGFRQNPSIMRTSLDHPEIYLQLSAAKHPMKGMLDLQHLLPETATIATDIPKTIIFMDSCAMILEAERLFRNWMADLDYPTESNTWVKPYFSSMAKVDKIATSETFGQISSECLATRILIATDAYGLGIDNPDVARVVQWQAPPSMSKLYQRLGRAMRNGSGLTSFLRIYQPSLVGPRSNKVLKRNQHDSGASGKILEDSEGKTKNNDKGATRRANLSLGLWEMINAPGQVCVRNVGLQHFSARDASASSRPPSDRCCSSCHPELAVELKTPPKLETKDWEDARRAPWIQHHLIVWREQKMLAVLSVRWHDKPSYNMPESVLQLLAQRASKAKSIESLRRVIGNGWPQLRQYWQEILAIT